MVKTIFTFVIEFLSSFHHLWVILAVKQHSSFIDLSLKMDDDVEVEDFEITDRDLMEGFGLGFRRHRMTREEAIYGMWAERDSDDDEGPRGYSKKRKKDYTKPLNFVSGGIVQKGKDKNLDDDGTNLVTVFLLYTYNKILKILLIILVRFLYNPVHLLCMQQFHK